MVYLLELPLDRLGWSVGAALLVVSQLVAVAPVLLAVVLPAVVQRSASHLVEALALAVQRSVVLAAELGSAAATVLAVVLVLAVELAVALLAVLPCPAELVVRPVVLTYLVELLHLYHLEPDDSLLLRYVAQGIAQ